MANIKDMLRKVLVDGDEPSDLVCFYQPVKGDRYGRKLEKVRRCTFTQLPERDFDDGYGLEEGEPLLAFSPRYVYVKGSYDGSEWIEPIPRDPQHVNMNEDLPSIGGG